jgi:hypothetical protein
MYLGLAVLLFVLIIVMRLIRSSETGGGGPIRTFRIDSVPTVFTTGLDARIGSGIGESSDPVTRMKQLREMKEAGLITDDEYESKRSEILDKI